MPELRLEMAEETASRDDGPRDAPARLLFHGHRPSALLRAAFALALLAPSSCAGSRRQDESIQLEVLREVKRDATRPLSRAANVVVQRDGFVIVPSVSPPSFHFGYTALFEADQPMYLTADAVLHTVHASFDDILADIEQDSLIRELNTFLDELRRALPPHTTSTATTRAEVDEFLAVAKSLLRGEAAAPVAGASPESIATLVTAATEATGARTVSLFGQPVDMDFSMLKPRGHYTRSRDLERYFRALAWLGRAELRLAISERKGEMKLQRGPLAAALAIAEMMTPRAEKAWQRIDRAADRLIGPADSMSLLAFRKASEAIGLDSSTLPAIGDAQVLDALVPLGEQRINTQLITPLQATLPLWIFGQRYVADSEVLSATSYGKLPQKRMMPSPLDVAAALFENPEAHALLAPSYRRFTTLRPAVDAVAEHIADMGPSLFRGSMSHLWLDALRSLSQETPSGLPAMMTTSAWNRRLLNTQLASWAERRHDTILYAKQSVTMIAGCSFPRAYVDPYPRFYARLISFAELGRSVIGQLELTPDRAEPMRRYFGRLKSVLTLLQAIAERERAGKPMSTEHLDFMNRAVSVHGRRIGSGSDIAYTVGGWFADLYYRNESAKFHRPTIADVHTQPTDESGNPVGKVLHVGTGRPQLIEVEVKGQRYRGFVSTYHEITTDSFERLDDRWMEQHVRSGTLALEPWLEAYTAD